VLTGKARSSGPDLRSGPGIEISMAPEPKIGSQQRRCDFSPSPKPRSRHHTGTEEATACKGWLLCLCRELTAESSS